MSNSMQHLNGDIFCVIDVETTGDILGHHEVVQICLLPLDSNMEVIQDVLPFYMNIKPDRPEAAQKAAMKVNKLDMFKLCSTGIDKFAAIGLLKNWMYETLKLPYNKSGYHRCRVVPVGHNYCGFDYGFIRAWFDECSEDYNEFFSFHPRDTMIFAAGINDRMAMRAKAVPFPKLGLKDIAKVLGVDYDTSRHHDALYDCQLTANVFKQLAFTDIVGMY